MICSLRASRKYGIPFPYPSFSYVQISGTTVGDIRLVDNMHARKAMMFDEADAFITIPGGFGTLDETLEITTWQQLGFHSKPVGILNIKGYFDHLLAFFDHSMNEVSCYRTNCS